MKKIVKQNCPPRNIMQNVLPKRTHLHTLKVNNKAFERAQFFSKTLSRVFKRPFNGILANITNSNFLFRYLKLRPIITFIGGISISKFLKLLQKIRSHIS